MSGKPYTPEEDQFILAQRGKAKAMPYAEIARHLGRNPGAVQIRYSVLRNKKPGPPAEPQAPAVFARETHLRDMPLRPCVLPPRTLVVNGRALRIGGAA